MNTDKKILEYLDRAERYICTPLEQRDPDEFKALMALKADLRRDSAETQRACAWL